MDPLAFIFGIAVVCVFILLLPYLLEYGFPMKYGNEDGEQWILSHSFLKVVSIGICIALMLLVPTISLQEKDTCAVELNQTVSAVSGSTTTTNHTYAKFCFADEHRTESIFFTTTMWSLRIFFLYIGVFVIIIGIYVWRSLAKP